MGTLFLAPTRTRTTCLICIHEGRFMSKRCVFKLTGEISHNSGDVVLRSAGDRPQLVVKLVRCLGVLSSSLVAHFSGAGVKRWPHGVINLPSDTTTVRWQRAVKVYCRCSAWGDRCQCLSAKPWPMPVTLLRMIGFHNHSEPSSSGWWWQSTETHVAVVVISVASRVACFCRLVLSTLSGSRSVLSRSRNARPFPVRKVQLLAVHKTMVLHLSARVCVYVFVARNILSSSCCFGHCSGERGGCLHTWSRHLRLW